jgi:hypothetical protein
MAPAHSPMVPHVHELTAFQVPFRTSLIHPTLSLFTESTQINPATLRMDSSLRFLEPL